MQPSTPMHPAFRALDPADIPDVIDEAIARQQLTGSLSFDDLPALIGDALARKHTTAPADGSPSPAIPPPAPTRAQPPAPRQAEGLVQRGDFFPAAPSPPRCHSLNAAGQPCSAAPRTETGLCIYHDPAYAEEHRMNSRLGGEHSGLARQQMPLVDLATVNLSDREGVQALIDAVLRLELSARLPPSRSRVLVRLLSLAVRNLDQPVPGAAASTYALRREALDAHLIEIADALAADELTRRVQSIADAGSKRQEILKANDRFTPYP